MAKDPAVLFYYQDFLVGTEFMNDTDVGKYIRLLCHQFDKGKLSEKQVLSICKASAIEKVEPEIISKLKNDGNGFYYNQRAMDEKDKRKKFVESRRHNALGKKEIKKSKTYAEHMEDINENEIKDKKKKYGAYNHVLLTDKQYADLIGKVDNRENWIQIMDEAIEEKGNIWHIKNFYLALIKWYKKENGSNDRQSKPKKRINHYDYECPNCNKPFHKRELKGDVDYDLYRCDENDCQTVGLGKDGKNMVGVQLKFIRPVYKENGQ